FTSLNLTFFLSHLLLPFFLLFPFSSKGRILRIVLPIILMILQSCVLLPYNLIEKMCIPPVMVIRIMSGAKELIKERKLINQYINPRCFLCLIFLI
ncbi:hypothetical protein KSS87_003648, partial [Heliosperma pusillum]